MISTLSTFWTFLLQYGSQHGVDPLVFAGFYIARMPFLFAITVWLGINLRYMRPIVGLLILAVVLWLLPFAYIFIFGRDLPWWFYVLLLAVMILAGWQFSRNIRRRLITATRR